MSTRSEIEALFAQTQPDADVQVFNALAGDADTYNNNILFANLNALRAAVLTLADKVDALSK